MEFTSFQKLKIAVARLGANPVVANLDKHLSGQGISVDSHSDQVVVGENGIYYVDPKGVLAKTVIHIVDINVNVSYAKGLKEVVKNEEFESEYLLDKIHKYHLMNCKMIQKAESEGWRKHRYHLSRRQNGYFYYRFVENSSVFTSRDDQKLYACKFCLNELKAVTGKNFTRESFDLEDFLSSDFKDLLNIEGHGKYTDECAPNIYKHDWRKISKTYRNLIKFQCESSDCPNPDLSDSRYMKYLHTHHVSFDKSNNDYSNLKALCIYCHSNQPNHSHIKNSPDYKEYVSLRGIE